jgi:hypothetical protein
MAGATGNGPLAPHMLLEISLRCVDSIVYDVLVKRICVSPAMSRYKSPKHSDGEARFMSSSLHHRSILWDLDWISAGENHIRLLGESSRGIFDSICGARGAFPVAPSIPL